jgi:hypothetical protein
MADVQIQGSPEKSGANWAWAIVVIALIAVIAWFMFGRSGGDSGATVDAGAGTNPPAATTPPATKTP